MKSELPEESRTQISTLEALLDRIQQGEGTVSNLWIQDLSVAPSQLEEQLFSLYDSAELSFCNVVFENCRWAVVSWRGAALLTQSFATAIFPTAALPEDIGEAVSGSQANGWAPIFRRAYCGKAAWKTSTFSMATFLGAGCRASSCFNAISAGQISASAI